jgi:hypothetical protein
MSLLPRRIDNVFAERTSTYHPAGVSLDSAVLIYKHPTCNEVASTSIMVRFT